LTNTDFSVIISETAQGADRSGPLFFNYIYKQAYSQAKKARLFKYQANKQPGRKSFSQTVKEQTFAGMFVS